MTTPDQPAHQSSNPSQPEVLRDHAPRERRRDRRPRSVRSLAGLAVVAVLAGVVAVAASLLSGGDPETGAAAGSRDDQVVDDDAPAWAPNGAWVSTESELDAALGLDGYIGSGPAPTEDEMWARNGQVEAALEPLGFGPRLDDGSEPSVEPALPDGFTGVVLDTDGRRITLWSVGGTWPQELLDATSAAHPEVTVDVLDAPYARAELEAIAAEHDVMGVAGVNGMSIREDGTALVVTHDPGTTPDVEGLARETGVPIVLVPQEAAVPLALTETVGP